MRSHSGGERALLAGDHNVHVRVEVQNVDLTWKNLTDLLGVDFFESASWDEQIDSPVSGGQIVLKREAEGVSLAPLLSTSDANVDDLGDYAPLLDGNRGLRIYTAVTAVGADPVSGDWKLVMDAKIDRVNWGDPGLVITFRDIGARTMDAFIREPVIYGEAASGLPDEGVDVENIIQSILDDNDVPGSPVLFVPAATSTKFRAYRQEQMAVFEAIRNLALQIGFDLRHKFTTGDNFPLVLYEPDRDSETPVITLGSDEYLNLPEVSLGDDDIRNLIRVTYQDRDSGEIETVERNNEASQDLYDERFMEVSEAASSNIDTDAEAQALADAIAKDLGTPLATQAIETFYFWPVQLNDIIGLEANDVHYDEPQRIAASSIRHELSNGTGKTTIAGRGKPLGAFEEWLKRIGQGRRPLDLQNRVPVLLNFRLKEQTPTTRVYTWVRGSLTRQVWVGQARYDIDAIPDDPWALVKQNALDTPPLDDDVDELTVLMPAEGEALFIQVEPRGVDLFAGEVRRVELYGTKPPFDWVSEITHPTNSTGKLEITIDDPRSVIDTVRFWRTFKGVRTGPIAATVAAPPIYSFTTTLDPKHSVLLQAQFKRNDGEPDFWTDIFSLDTDKDADITRAAVSYSTDQFSVLVDGDEDTASLWAQEFVDGDWEAEFELDYRPPGTDQRFGILEGTASADEKRIFRVYGKNDDGVAGESVPVEIDQYVLAVLFVQCIAEMTAIDEDTMTVEVRCVSPTGGTGQVELVALAGGVSIASGNAIGVPTASPGTWVFNRGTELGIAGSALFRATEDDLEPDEDTIFVPEVGRDTVPLKIALIPIISPDPAYQWVRAMFLDPEAELSTPYGEDTVSVSYQFDGVPSVTHSHPKDSQGLGYTINPQLLGYITRAFTTGTRPDVPSFTSFIDFAVERPAFGEDPGRLSVFAEHVDGDRVQDADSVTILPVDRKQIEVLIEQVDEDSTTVEVQVTVVDPMGTGGITLTESHTANVVDVTPSGSGALASGGTRNFIIDLPAFRAGKGQVRFTASATDRVSGSNFVDVNEILPDPAGVVQLTIDDAGKLDATGTGDSEVKSWLYLASNSAQPSVASTISGGTLITTRDFVLQDLVDVPNPGRGYLTLVPYYFSSAAGTPGLAIQVYVDRADTIGAPFIAPSDPDEGGDVDYDISGDTRTLSYKVAWDTSPPDEAAIDAATPVNGQSISATADANLEMGEELHLGAKAFTAVSGGGEESPIGRASVKRQNKSVSKFTVRSASTFIPFVLGPPTDLNADGLYMSVGEDSGTLHGYAHSSVALPPGCTITGWEMISACSASGTQKAELKLYRTTGAGGRTLIGTLTNSGSSGAFITTSDLALSELVGDLAYYVTLELDWTNAGGSTTKFAEMTIHYDSPALDVSV